MFCAAPCLMHYITLLDFTKILRLKDIFCAFFIIYSFHLLNILTVTGILRNSPPRALPIGEKSTWRALEIIWLITGPAWIPVSRSCKSSSFRNGQPDPRDPATASCREEGGGEGIRSQKAWVSKKTRKHENRQTGCWHFNHEIDVQCKNRSFLETNSRSCFNSQSRRLKYSCITIWLQY